MTQNKAPDQGGEAQKKAKEFLDKFCGKKCALTCIDEMILSYEAADGDHAPQYYYWQQFRTQIINLKIPTP